MRLCKLQALVYDILFWRKVPESDARSVAAMLAQLSAGVLSAGVLAPDVRLTSGLKLRNAISGPRP